MFRSTIGHCPYMGNVDSSCNSTCNWANNNSMQNRFYCVLFEIATKVHFSVCIQGVKMVKLVKFVNYVPNLRNFQSWM